MFDKLAAEYQARSMTLPDERYRAIKNTMEFLIRLSAGEYPRVPRGVREEARSLLRHYPGTFDLDQLERAAPDIIQQRMEPVHRMIAAYEAQTPEHVGGQLGLEQLHQRAAQTENTVGQWDLDREEQEQNRGR